MTQAITPRNKRFMFPLELGALPTRRPVLEGGSALNLPSTEGTDSTASFSERIHRSLGPLLDKRQPAEWAEIAEQEAAPVKR
jgi:hypothetical protein